MSHGNGNPFGQRLTPEQLQALAQQSRTPQIDIATFKYLKCDCGSVKMEHYTFALMKINPIVPQEYAVVPMQALRCFGCKKHPIFDKEAGGWKFQVEEPPLNVE